MATGGIFASFIYSKNSSFQLLKYAEMSVPGGSATLQTYAYLQDISGFGSTLDAVWLEDFGVYKSLNETMVMI
jgi:hypothetical protein